MLKYRVDGFHTDLRITRAKIILDKSGEPLNKILTSRDDVEYFIMLPEELINNFRYFKSINPRFDSNRNYLAIDIGTIGLGYGNPLWKISIMNTAEYCNWFAANHGIDKTELYSPERLEPLVELFIKQNSLAAFK